MNYCSIPHSGRLKPVRSGYVPVPMILFFCPIHLSWYKFFFNCLSLVFSAVRFLIPGRNIPIWEPLFFDGKFIRVSGNERVPAYSLCPEKNNDVVCDFPNIFFVQNFSNSTFLKRECRKKKAQTQMGNDSQSKKKVSGQKTKPRQRF